jgi:hypothetical protein
MIEQLQLLCMVTWDGNLISKTHRDELVRAGLAQRLEGYNFITVKGLRYLIDLGLLPKTLKGDVKA